jgi:hypothetical protein
MGGHEWHPGYAWAARRSALSDLGGLGDIGILGSGDHHMACALIDRVLDSIHGSVHPTFKDYWLKWQERCGRFIKQDVGCMAGTITHQWHGSKINRKYNTRWRILTENGFDYTQDLSKDIQGLWQFTNNKPKLRDQIRGYFSQRNEDSIDVMQPG